MSRQSGWLERGSVWALVLLSCQVGTAASRETDWLNVVVVMVDDLGWADLSCQGSRFYQTPHIDGLAAGGARFTHGYAACAVCSPTRAAYLTGRYPARLGITDWIRARWQRGGRRLTEQDRPPAYEQSSKRKLLCPRNPFWMDHEQVTLAEELQAAGYVTGHIGKWHLGDTRWYPRTQGFVENVGGCDFGHPPSYFDPFTKRQDPHVWTIETMASRTPGEYLTDREADEAVAFITKHRDRPFFLSLCHYAVHTPIQAKPALVEVYQQRTGARGQKNAKYAAMIHSVDDAMGKVTTALKEHALTDRTLIIFTSDNGGLEPITNNPPLREGKGTPYEGGIRVPWIISWPGVIPPGTVSEMPIITCDIKPTVLDAVGVPSTDTLPIDGKSLLPHLQNGVAQPPSRSLFWHFPHYRRGYGPYAIVRRGGHKLIRFFEDNRRELFDLTKDVAEQHDLAESQPERVAKLDRELSDWLANVGARLPQPNPAFAGAPAGPPSPDY